MGTAGTDQLVLDNLGLARRVAYLLWHRLPLVRQLGDLDDVVQTAMLGLTRAARGFDPSLGYTFSSYAWPAMQRELIREAKATALVHTPQKVNVRQPERLHPIAEGQLPARPEPDGTREISRPLLRVLALLTPLQREALLIRAGVIRRGHHYRDGGKACSHQGVHAASAARGWLRGIDPTLALTRGA